MSFMSHVEPRLGLKEGFADIIRAQVHQVATAVMSQCKGNVHENVIGYQSKELETKCDHEIQMAKNLDSYYFLFIVQARLEKVMKIRVNPHIFEFHSTPFLCLPQPAQAETAAIWLPNLTPTRVPLDLGCR